MLATELIAVLGKDASDSEVTRTISDHRLNDVSEYPAFRRYIGSKSKGVDLLIEDDRVVDVQIHVQPTESRSAYSDTLPFGIQSEMTQSQVHELLGQPQAADNIDSKYVLPGNNCLTVVYDKQGKIRYISVGLPLD